MKNYLKLGTKFLLTMSLSFLFLAVEAQERNLSGKVLQILELLPTLMVPLI